MANNSYIKGRKREYQLKDILEKNGYLVIRSAGSKGIDLVAINDKRQNILLINIGSKDKPLLELLPYYDVWRITYNSNKLKELKEKLKLWRLL